VCVDSLPPCPVSSCVQTHFGCMVADFLFPQSLSGHPSLYSDIAAMLFLLIDIVVVRSFGPSCHRFLVPTATLSFLPFIRPRQFRQSTSPRYLLQLLSLPSLLKPTCLSRIHHPKSHHGQADCRWRIHHYRHFDQT
jgi:hypothetical protein